MSFRVLHVTPYMDSAAGGPPVVVERLLHLAPTVGHLAEVLTPRGQQDVARAGSTTLPSQSAALYGTGRRAVEEAVGEADILHLHTLWSPLVAMAASTARRRGVPYVLSPHGMLDPWSLAQKALKKQLYWQLVEKSVAQGAASLVFTSAAERDRAEKKIQTPGVVIPLGADAGPAPREDLARAFLDRHPDLTGRSLLIFLGRLHHKKRPEAIIAAMPRILEAVPGAVLLLVGSGEPEAVARLRRDAESLGEAVRFLGLLTGEDKWQALAAAQLFILPSRQENFAIAAAEALRVGTPVLLTRKVDICDQVIAAKAGLALDEGDIVHAIAETGLALMKDNGRRAVMSANAMRLAETTFTWPECAGKTHDLYCRILGQA